MNDPQHLDKIGKHDYQQKYLITTEKGENETNSENNQNLDREVSFSTSTSTSFSSCNTSKSFDDKNLNSSEKFIKGLCENEVLTPTKRSRLEKENNHLSKECLNQNVDYGKKENTLIKILFFFLIVFPFFREKY